MELPQLFTNMPEAGRKVTLDRIAQHLSTEMSIAVTLSVRTTAEEVICAKSCFAALVISTS